MSGSKRFRFQGIDEIEIGCKIRPPSIAAAAGRIEGKNPAKLFEKIFQKGVDGYEIGCIVGGSLGRNVR
jgi:hypothetical protein